MPREVLLIATLSRVNNSNKRTCSWTWPTSRILTSWSAEWDSPPVDVGASDRARFRSSCGWIFLMFSLGPSQDADVNAGVWNAQRQTIGQSSTPPTCELHRRTPLHTPSREAVMPICSPPEQGNTVLSLAFIGRPST